MTKIKNSCENKFLTRLMKKVLRILYLRFKVHRLWKGHGYYDEITPAKEMAYHRYSILARCNRSYAICIFCQAHP